MFKRFHLSRDLAMMRLYYLVSIGGGGLFNPFYALFQKSQGLSGTEIGLLGPLSSLVAVIASPLWGRWNDRSKQTRLLLQIGLLGCAAGILGLRWQTAFWGFAAFSMLQALFGAGLDPLSTSLAMSTVKKHHQSGFGSIRRWGSFGWAILVPLGGWLVERTGLSIIFWGYALALVASAIILNWVEIPPDQASRTPQAGLGLFRQIRQVLRTPPLAALLLALVLTGILGRGVQQFQNIFLDQLGASKSIIGIASMVGALVELPAMLWADRLTRRWGAGRILAAAYGLDALRMLATLLLPHTVTIVAMNAVGGLSLSLRIVALIAYITGNAPQEQGSTMLALFNVTLPNLIVMAASPLGGAAFDLAGAYWLYALALAGFLLAAGGILFANRQGAKQMKSESDFSFPKD